MQRMMITLLIAFAVGIVLGKLLLPLLHKLKFGQNIYELAPEAHKKKQGTPTMGGRGNHCVADYERLQPAASAEHAAGDAAYGTGQPVHRLC